MRVTFLGTSGAVPTVERNPSAVLLRREGERLLFDCGEGTQRQMMRYSTGFGISHIFVTHLHADHVLGIPGLLQTLDFNDRTEPLAIHAPQGTRRRLEDLITAAGDRPTYPLRINQVQPGETVLDREDYRVEAFETDHRTTSVGYALVEDDRKGRFDREKAEEELGLPPGPEYSKLHAGEPVEHDGRTIRPEQIVGPPRPGRRVVYTGDTRPTAATVEAATDADLLIHEATFAEDRRDRAGQTGHTTAKQAAELANRAGAKQLVLTHISTRYAGNSDQLEREAREVFEGDHAEVADDGLKLDVPFPSE
ncbi:ribonuclease Z [Halapricum salinum]|uniref:Ribonuclease Z n=1 Tax=Halapricum salinum TaxID=1457250 RepID=A0A4D6H9Z8_9EURY|nr:ribonuclease Z [Halapricum salinum]QCC50739.1 ribonuclease Z [Halapricum salinum]